MSAVSAPAQPEAPLARLLVRELAARLPDCDVPSALWERALIAPLREFLSRPGKQLRARLVEAAYALAGGEPAAMPDALPLLIELLHAGSLIVDDIEDDSQMRRGAPALHALHGIPLALNAGNLLYFLPQAVLAELPFSPAVRLCAYEQLSSCLLRCHQGQALDLSARVDQLPQQQVPAVVAAITSLKTGALLELALSLGALCAGAAPERMRRFGALGREVGLGLQMLDDLSGVVNVKRRDKTIEDLIHARATWVWAWLAEGLDPDAYARTLRSLTALRTGGSAPRLIERLHFRVGALGQRRARAQLAAAASALRKLGCEGAACAAFERELGRLERSFLEAGA